jgi:transmembrane sensor
MEYKKMPIRKHTRQIKKAIHHHGGQTGDFSGFENDRVLQDILGKVDDLKVFDRINTGADWILVYNRMGQDVSLKYGSIPWKSYFARIAALVILTAGLSLGVYQIIIKHPASKTDIVSVLANNQVREIYLPDGSSVTLNSGSSMTYNRDFGSVTRDVKLRGEAFFDVVHIASVPFRIRIDASVVEVLGTKFSVCQTAGKVKVSVISGKVLLFSADSVQNKISIAAHQSGYMLSNKELKIEDGLSANILSWKTGHLIFNQTPIDSALGDIAHHFRKNLIQESTVHVDITAEFQNQTLSEILEEIKLVAGIHIDTTDNALIVRK